MTSITSSLLIQVVPQLRPGQCGLSDHALPLARELKSAFGIDSAFVVLNSNERCNSPHATVYAPATRLLESCLELTQGYPGAVLVHVSGYGYSADGAPTLLANGLEKVGSSGQFRMAAYFHETYASGPPWKSAFWYMRRQKKALLRILAQCGLIRTNIGLHAEWLERAAKIVGGAPVELMPVFSTVGETEDPPSLAQRNPVMALFGRASTREWAYRKLATAEDLLGVLGIQEILDIGPECNHPQDVNGIRVNPLGLLPAELLPGVFSRAPFGFVPHPWYNLGKSSVFAAFCAQGTIPVLGEPFPKEADGLRDGVQVVSPQTAEAVRRSGWEDCSRAAWNWYMGHRLYVHAERYSRWLGGVR